MPLTAHVAYPVKCIREAWMSVTSVTEWERTEQAHTLSQYDSKLHQPQSHVGRLTENVYKHWHYKVLSTTDLSDGSNGISHWSGHLRTTTENRGFTSAGITEAWRHFLFCSTFLGSCSFWLGRVDVVILLLFEHRVTSPPNRTTESLLDRRHDAWLR